MNKKTRSRFSLNSILKVLALIMIFIGGLTIAKMIFIIPILTLFNSAVMLYQMTGSTELFVTLDTFFRWWIVSLALFVVGSLILYLLKCGEKWKKE